MIKKKSVGRAAGLNENTGYIAAHIALRPFEYSRTMLEETSRLTSNTVIKAMKVMDGLDWISERKVASGFSRPQLVLGLNVNFWRELDAVELVAPSKLSADERILYQEAIDASVAQSQKELGLEKDRELASYRGRVALLGERHDLAEDQLWFPAVAGWDVLVQIVAARAVDNRVR